MVAIIAHCLSQITLKFRPFSLNVGSMVNLSNLLDLFFSLFTQSAALFFITTDLLTEFSKMCFSSILLNIVLTL